MNSITIYNHLAESASAIQRHGGQVPAPDPTLRAFFAAFVWQTGILGVHTGDQASVLTGVPRATVDYARLVLASGDVALLDAVLAKTLSLRQASLLVRQGIRLIGAYVNSSPTNKAYLGRTVGAEKVFDEVIVPALDPTTAAGVMATVTASEATAPKSNGKVTNGTGNGHLYARQSVPPTLANVSTH